MNREEANKLIGSKLAQVEELINEMEQLALDHDLNFELKGKDFYGSKLAYALYQGYESVEELEEAQDYFPESIDRGWCGNEETGYWMSSSDYC